MPLDDDDWKKLGEILNAATKKTMAETVKVIDERLKPIHKQIESFDARGEEQNKSDQAETPEATPKDGKGSDPEVAALRAQLAEMKEQRKKDQEERKAAEEKAKRDKLHNAVRDALIGEGVPPERARAALALLKDENRLDFDDQEQPGIRFQRQGYAEIVAGKGGVSEWLKSDTGKMFLPPSDVQGSGQRSGRTPPKSTGEPTPVESLSRNLYTRALGG